MNYINAEQSRHDASPIECYKFIGSWRTYRYTSGDVPVTVNGEMYTPVAATRNSIRAGTQTEDTLALEIEMPFDVAVIKDYAYALSPPRLVLEVYRVHRGTNYASDWALYWKGKVSAFTVTGRKAKVRVPSIFATALQADLPSAYWQAPCNHVLFDGRCRASKQDWTQTTTVLEVGTDALEVVDDGFSDGVLIGGELICNRNGERRLITNNATNIITINYPFVDLQAGDTVELVAGCDHSFTTCRTKFNNAKNFGGHPLIPSDNPFEGEL